VLRREAVVHGHRDRRDGGAGRGEVVEVLRKRWYTQEAADPITNPPPWK